MFKPLNCVYCFFFCGCKKSFKYFALSVDGKEEVGGWGDVITRQQHTISLIYEARAAAGDLRRFVGLVIVR